ncbi:choline dehydrogenase [Phocaeicola dorei CAG:222]|nr:choline dehydrogenase [Phocaeicola dorei CAG:222]
MNGIGMMLPCSFNDIIYIQITFFGSGRPYQAGFVCIHHMTRRTVGFRKNSHSADTHLFTRAHNAHGYLATVGN